MGPPFTQGYTPVSKRGGKRPGSGRKPQGSGRKKKKETAVKQKGNAVPQEDVPQPSVEVDEFIVPVNHQDTGRPTKRLRISDLTFGGEHDNSKEATFDKALYDLKDYDVVDSNEVLPVNRTGIVPVDEDLEGSEEDELSMLPTPKKGPYPLRRSVGSSHAEEWTDEIPSESLYAPTRSAKKDTRKFFCSYKDCPQSEEVGGGFTIRSHLERHQGVHNPNVFCVWGGCDRVFSQVVSMRAHVKRIHLKGGQDGTAETDVDIATNDAATNNSDVDEDQDSNEATTGGAAKSPTEVSPNENDPSSEFYCSYEGCPRSKAKGGRMFSSKTARHSHEATHNPSINCTWPDCDKVFARIDNMRTHFNKIHLKVQPALQPDVATIASNINTRTRNHSRASLDSAIDPKRGRGRPRQDASKAPKETPNDGPQIRKSLPLEPKDPSQAAKEAAQLLNQAAQAPSRPVDARPTLVSAPIPRTSDAQAMLEVMKLQGQAAALEAEAKKLQADAWNLRIEARELELSFQS